MAELVQSLNQLQTTCYLITSNTLKCNNILISTQCHHQLIDQIMVKTIANHQR